MSDSKLNLSALSVDDVRDGIAAGDFSAAEVTDAAYARIDAVETEVHAFNQLTRELADAAAARIEAARVRTPDVHGGRCRVARLAADRERRNAEHSRLGAAALARDE